MKKISIVIPARNEERRIEKTLSAYSDYFDDLERKGVIAYEIIVVINASKDKTEEITKDFSLKNKKIRYLNLERGGKGHAIIEGFKDALKRKNDYIGFVDADLASPPKSFYFLIKNMKGYEAAIASRRLKNSFLSPKQTLIRKITGIGFNIFVRSVLHLKYKDTQCGCKVFREDALREITESITMSQWAFDIEILYLLKRKSFEIIELPTIWRSMDDSKVRIFRTTFQMFFSVLQMRIIYSPFRKILRPTKFLVNLLWKAIK